MSDDPSIYLENWNALDTRGDNRLTKGRVLEEHGELQVLGDGGKQERRTRPDAANTPSKQPENETNVHGNAALSEVTASVTTHGFRTKR